MTGPSATGTVDIAVPAEAAYAVITDLDAMAEIAEETVAMRWTSGTGAEPGAVFKGSNRNGWRRWSTSCAVTDAVPGRCFVFEVTSLGRVPVATWRYDVEALDAHHCRVTESTWDRRPGWFKVPAGLATGVGDRDAASRGHIATTLARLKVHAER